MCHLLRYRQQQWTITKEGLQDLSQEVPWQLHYEMVCEKQQERVSSLQVSISMISV